MMLRWLNQIPSVCLNISWANAFLWLGIVRKDHRLILIILQAVVQFDDESWAMLNC